MNSYIHSFKSRHFEGSTELAAAAAEILKNAEGFIASVAAETEEAYPTDRQVRYYTSLNLIPNPTERKRNAPLYSWKHLVALLAVHRLKQVERYPIRIITELVENKSEGELEELFVDGARVKLVTDPTAIEQYKQKTETELQEIFGERAQLVTDQQAISDYVETRAKNATTEFLESLLPQHSAGDAVRPKGSPRTPRPTPHDLSLSAAVPTAPAETAPETTYVTKTWMHIAIAPGVELHIEEGIRTPLPPEEIRRIVDQLLKPS
jgi:DNA-binding transcriptional MerR regulator